MDGYVKRLARRKFDLCALPLFCPQHSVPGKCGALFLSWRLQIRGSV